MTKCLADCFIALGPFGGATLRNCRAWSVGQEPVIFSLRYHIILILSMLKPVRCLLYHDETPASAINIKLFNMIDKKDYDRCDCKFEMQ